MFNRWRRKRILARHAIPEAAWRAARARAPVLARLDAPDEARLRALALLFLHEKVIEPAAGAQLDDGARALLAAQACLPILNLGLDYYADFKGVIVYPDEFMPEHEYTDDAGVVHSARHPLRGEAWPRGPVILSAADLAPSRGMNVVIHEFAHKLDMLNGAADGFPPLHHDMRIDVWTQAFMRAYEDLCARDERGEATPIDAYAAESPAEFFAVASEAFFETPQILRGAYPEVYAQLRAFYRWGESRSE